jgi:PAS domain S-box-containing protein
MKDPEQLRLFVEAAPMAAVVADASGTVVLANERAAMLFDCPREALIGRGLGSLIPGLGADGPQSRDQVAVRPRKGTAPVEVALNRISTADGEFSLVALVDISERRSTEEHLRLVVEGAPNANLVVDDAGRITLVNAQTERLFGYNRVEMLGMPVDLLVPERFRTAHGALRVAYHGTASPRLMGAGRELYCLRKDGTEVPVEIGLNPIRTPKGDFVLASVIDITERKLLEELRRERDRAVDASELKSQFVATMSHELRTPLNAIIAAAELLTSTELDSRQRAYAETIDESAEALLAVISSILDFSKIEAGKLDLEMRTFELEALVEGAAGVLASQVRQKGLRLHVYIDPSIPGVVRGDADRLRQILLNLISNAVKFTSEGKIFVRALSVETSSRHAIVRFEVEDTGIGIESDTVAKLFEPFVQADGSSSRRFGGTGLGLSISKRLVALMNGEIGVTTEAGRGSVFWFTAEFGRPSAVVPSRRLFGVRMLLISTDQVFQDIAGRYAEAWGIATHPAADGAAALEIIQRRSAAERHEDWLAIVDVATVDAGATVRLLTAHGMPARSVLRAGAGERLPRPLRHSQLFDSIAEALEEPRDATAKAAEPPKPGDASTARRVLVAEDNAALRQILADQFAHLDVSATIVGNGAEAVAALAREPFALVFMDCHMPELDGFAATRAIRDAEKATGAHVPIVAMTANAFKEDREACLAIGMDDYLAKPVRLADLRDALSRWIAEPKREPELT